MGSKHAGSEDLTLGERGTFHFSVVEIAPHPEPAEGSVDFRHSDAVSESSEKSTPFDPTHWLLLIFRIPTELGVGMIKNGHRGTGAAGLVASECPGHWAKDRSSVALAKQF
jgi:hypothetical protein